MTRPPRNAAEIGGSSAIATPPVAVVSKLRDDAATPAPRPFAALAGRAGVPGRLLAALLLAAAYAVFLCVDQSHWWRLKPDYAFGWLVPLFVGYVVMERWPRLRTVLRAEGSGRGPRRRRSLFGDTVMVLVFAGGLGCFLLGALYRAGAGATQPGSLALAIGFAGVLPGLVYFNTPADVASRRRVMMLFIFPALVWVISAPLVTAVENAISLYLLRKVTTVVFTVFSLLGYPLMQEGNVLVLPLGRVGVAEACSGIRSLTGCLFAGSFLAAVFLERFWQKVLLVALALALAFFTNLLRSLFLTAWAYAYGSAAIEGTLHDATGFAVLGLTCAGLLAMLPVFSAARWRRWLKIDAVSSEQ